MRHRKLIGVLVIAGISAAAAGSPGLPRGTADKCPRFTYRRTEAMVAMRDGTRLRTEIYLPEPSPGPLPFLIDRTPYGAGGDDQGHPKLATSYKELADEGYIFVFQDIRGRYGSEGKFVMLRPPRDKGDPKAVDESTDTSDTIAWLLANVPGNNGRVGHARRFLRRLAYGHGHARSPSGAQGRLPAGLTGRHVLGGRFLPRRRLPAELRLRVRVHDGDVERRFSLSVRRHTIPMNGISRLGALANVECEISSTGRLPTWNDFVAHSDYDAFWKKIAVTPYLGRVTVPTLNVAGWWDQEDFFGPLDIYKKLEARDTGHMNYFVAGPWNHGGWARDGSFLGRIKFGKRYGVILPGKGPGALVRPFP